MKIREAARRWFAKEPEETTREDLAEHRHAAPVVRAADAEYIEKVREAWTQWQAAQNYFENVSDPELVDFAIYDLEASRRRYIYMLKQTESIALS